MGRIDGYDAKRTLASLESADVGSISGAQPAKGASDSPTTSAVTPLGPSPQFAIGAPATEPGRSLAYIAPTAVEKLDAPSRRNLAAVVRYGSATGFLVFRAPIEGTCEDCGLIFTNHHIAGPYRFQSGRPVLLGDGRIARTVRLIESAGSTDHALVEIRLPRDSAATPCILDPTPPNVGDTTYLLGSLQHGFELSRGEVTEPSVRMSEFMRRNAGLLAGEVDTEMGTNDLSGTGKSRVFESSSPTHDGMSGSPVISSRTDRVIGIHNAGNGWSSTFVSMHRVLDAVRANPGVTIHDRALTARMLEWQSEASQRDVGASAPPRHQLRSAAEPIVFRDGDGTSDEERASIDDLGWLFFGNEAFAGGENRNLTVIAPSGELAGFATYRREGASLYLSHLAVSPSYQGQGAAGCLLERLERVGRATEGISNIKLDVRAENEHARAFYARHGFEVVGEHGRVAMEKKLN